MLCDSRWDSPTPAWPRQRTVCGGAPGAAQNWLQDQHEGHLPAPAPGDRGACKRVVLARASAPPPGWGGGGGVEGADGSNYGLDPPPPVAGGRKIGSSRFRGRRGGGLRGPPSMGGESASPGGDFLPPGTGLGDSLRKSQGPLPAPAPGVVLRPLSQ